MSKTKTLTQQLKAARRVSVPLIAICTPDPAATIAGYDQWASAGAADGRTGPVIVWDIVEGPRPRNDDGKDALANITEDPQLLSNPIEMLRAARKLPPGAILFMHLANRWLVDPAFVQAAWNLRDEFKRNRRMLVLLGPALELPAEIAGDVITLDEPLPDAEALRAIIGERHHEAALKITAEVSALAVEALFGLPAFQSEQIVAMSLRKEGSDIAELWERKRRQIEQTPGLKVHRDSVKFTDIGGVAVIKDFLKRITRGESRPNAVVFIDEIEKFMAGAAGNGADSSGVSQDQLGALLSYMQDHAAAGMIFVGPPGSAKSMVAKAAGSEAGVPTIQLDLGAMKGSLVGQSEQNLRAALKVITSVSNSKSLWIATCNAISDLPPELRRRFTLGTFFFDLPDADERHTIWKIYCPGDPKSRKTLVMPDDEGWTGAEIRACVDISQRLNCPLKEAAAFIVPVAKSAAEQISRLRKAAEGRFLSASKPGTYQQSGNADIPTANKRQLTLA